MAIGLLNLSAGIGLCRHFAHNAKEQSVTGSLKLSTTLWFDKDAEAAAQCRGALSSS
jgi:hypothetical protein